MWRICSVPNWDVIESTFGRDSPLGHPDTGLKSLALCRSSMMTPVVRWILVLQWVTWATSNALLSFTMMRPVVKWILVLRWVA